jgi:hypothetical protein
MIRPKHMTSQSIVMSLCGALVLLTFAYTSGFAADEDAPMQQSLTPGMRVRILTPEISSGKVVGTVKMVDDQSVTIDVPGRAEAVSVLREKISRLDVSEGPRSRGVDAAIGAGIGAGLGAAGGELASGTGKGHIVSRDAVAGIFALLGAGVGALIGVAVPPGEHWNEKPASRYRVGFAPRLDHGLDVALAWDF